MVGLGGFDQAVNLRADIGALGCVAKQPVLATDDEGPDGTLGSVIVDRQVAGFGVAQPAFCKVVVATAVFFMPPFLVSVAPSLG